MPNNSDNAKGGGLAVAEFIDAEGTWEETIAANGIVTRQLRVPSVAKLNELAIAESAREENRMTVDYSAYPPAHELAIALFQHLILNDPEAAVQIAAIQAAVTQVPDAERNAPTRSIWGRVARFFGA